jgi:hypothetical protein
MRTATRRKRATPAIPCSSRFSGRFCRECFNRSGDDSHKGISCYLPHFFLSLLARLHFLPYPLHTLTITRRPQLPSERIRPCALSRTLPLADARTCSGKQGNGSRQALLPISPCAQKHNISMYALEGNTSELPLFSRDNFLLSHFFTAHLRMGKDASNRTAIMRLLAWCDHGWPYSLRFRDSIRKQRAGYGRPQVWKEIVKS